ncbi:hypothetical protein R0K19_25835, partial [Bacillus sp. SIMBA_161]
MLILATCMLVLEANRYRLVPHTALPMVNTARFQWAQVVDTHRARHAFTEQLEESPLMAQALPGLA